MAGDFVFWYNLFGVLLASRTFIGMFFYRIGKISSRILLNNIFSDIELGFFSLFLLFLGLIFSLCLEFPGYSGLGAFYILYFL